MSIDATRAAGMRSSLLGQMANEHHTTLSVIRHAPDDRMDYAPHAGLRGFAELAHHIYAAGPWFVTIMEKGEFAPVTGASATPATKEDLVRQCEKLNRNLADRVNHLAPESLARIIEFPGAGPFPAISLLGWYLSHMIHHRGQLTVYLRMMGAKVPQVYGPTLDYPERAE